MFAFFAIHTLILALVFIIARYRGYDNDNAFELATMASIPAAIVLAIIFGFGWMMAMESLDTAPPTPKVENHALELVNLDQPCYGCHGTSRVFPMEDIQHDYSNMVVYLKGGWDIAQFHGEE